MTLRTTLLTSIAMAAFAANSLLCRAALVGDAIDPVSFTAIRLASGALILLPLSRRSGERPLGDARGSWGSALALFAYAAAFSLAYVTLDAGMGALILFGAVQLTMVGWGLRRGERLTVLQWVGLAASIGGLVYLVSPGLSAPEPAGAAAMGLAGIAWGVYSLRGRGAAAPIGMTAGNFLRSLPFAALLVVASGTATLGLEGILLATLSGSITSGIGYVVWYVALRGLARTEASVVQLSVPVIAAFGGAALLSEAVTMRLLVASALVLGGIAIVFARRVRGGEPSGE